MMGGMVLTGKPLVEGLAHSSSDGLVKELLIWLHSALMLSASPDIVRSISGTGEGGERKCQQGQAFISCHSFILKNNRTFEHFLRWVSLSNGNTKFHP